MDLQTGRGISSPRLPIHGSWDQIGKTTKARRSWQEPTGPHCQAARHRLFQSQKHSRQVEGRRENGESDQSFTRQKERDGTRRQRHHQDQKTFTLATTFIVTFFIVGFSKK